MLGFFKSGSSILASETNKISRGSANFFVAKRIIEEQIKYIHYNDYNAWFNITNNFVKEGKFEAVMFREDAVILAALKVQLAFGDHQSQFHKVGFIPEKDKVKYIHPAFLKDQSIEADVYMEHSRLAGSGEEKIKRQFVEKIRVLKRIEENVIPIYLYDIDKIEAIEAVLVIGEVFIVFDAQKQSILSQIPISDIKTMIDQHTGQTEREQLKKQVGQVALHLHQIRMDTGKDIIRILCINREIIRKRMKSVLEVMEQTKKEKQLLLDFQNQDPQVPLQPQSLIEMIQKQNVGLIAVQSWLMDTVKNEIVEIRIKIQDYRMEILNGFTNETIHNIPLYYITSWHQEAITPDIRTKLAESLKGLSSELFQLVILYNAKEPLRLLSLQRWKIRNVLKSFSDEISLYLKEEYICHSLNHSNLDHVVLRFKEMKMDLLDTSNNVIFDCPLATIHHWELNPIERKEELANPEKFKNLRLFDERNNLIAQLITEEGPHIIIELKKILFMERKKSHSQNLQMHIPLRGSYYENNKFHQFNSIYVCDNKMIVTDANETILKELAFSEIEEWMLNLDTYTSNQLLLTSSQPQMNDVKNLQNLINSITITHNKSNPHSIPLAF